MHSMKRYKFFVLALCGLVLSLFGCGGGGGDSAPASLNLVATVSFTGSGTVNAADVTITLPDGFVPAEDGTTGEVVVSQLTAANVASSYTPATTAANGMVQVSLIDNVGFAVPATLMTLKAPYVEGATLPTAGDFMLTVDAYEQTALNTVPLGSVGIDIALAEE
ncbi:MAG: hypothetical protein C0621_02335 [Desulfuromonas sp.]|nr:MAG: hypothetical protein C0621_02335 [Desulfuromonas sp.]